MLPTSPFQFERTRPQRLACYRAAELGRRRRILEVGAGQCPVAEEVAARTGRPVWALDRETPVGTPPDGVRFLRGEAGRLPLASGSLDALLFHFVLLWLPDPVAALREARRALAPGGAVLVLAEPDLTARRDEPDTGLGSALARAVGAAGGHPDAGARVGEWLAAAGFRPRLERTPQSWVAVEDLRETLHEVEALRAAGHLSDGQARTLSRAERAAGDQRRVLLPLSWGVAWKE